MGPWRDTGDTGDQEGARISEDRRLGSRQAVGSRGSPLGGPRGHLELLRRFRLCYDAALPNSRWSLSLIESLHYTGTHGEGEARARFYDRKCVRNTASYVTLYEFP